MNGKYFTTSRKAHIVYLETLASENSITTTAKRTSTHITKRRGCAPCIQEVPNSQQGNGYSEGLIVILWQDNFIGLLRPMS
jgi:hypothetical protein